MLDHKELCEATSEKEASETWVYTISAMWYLPTLFSVSH